MEELKMALESITDKKARSFLTMLGILIGVGAVLILVTVVTGMNADMEAYYEKLGVNKVYVTVTQYDRTNTLDITDELIDYVTGEMGDIAAGVTPDIEQSGTCATRAQTTGRVYFGNEQWSAATTIRSQTGATWPARYGQPLHGMCNRGVCGREPLRLYRPDRGDDNV